MGTTITVNFHSYSVDKYDTEIAKAIPGHNEIHKIIRDFFRVWWLLRGVNFEVLDLGAGTGITSKAVQDFCPLAKLTLVDFSEHMLQGARSKLGSQNVSYVVGDYTEIPFIGNGYDIVLSVIGLHHQSDENKLAMFKKVRSTLKPGGMFIFADLMSRRDQFEYAANIAKHFRHLADQFEGDEEALREWAYHHLWLNFPAPLEDHLDWLRQAGFAEVEIKFQKFETVLILAQ